MKTKTEEEVVVCRACKREIPRGESSWYYHESFGAVCRKHEGVEQWYSDLLEKLFTETEKVRGDSK